MSAQTGFDLTVPHGLGALRRADIVVVTPAGDDHQVDSEVLDALRHAHQRGARIVSLCTGAFVLAARSWTVQRRPPSSVESMAARPVKSGAADEMNRTAAPTAQVPGPEQENSDESQVWRGRLILRHLEPESVIR